MSGRGPELAHSGRGHVQAFRHARGRATLRTREDDAGAARDVRGAPRSVRQRIESLPFVGVQHQTGSGTACAHARLLIEGYAQVAISTSLISGSLD